MLVSEQKLYILCPYLVRLNKKGISFTPSVNMF